MHRSLLVVGECMLELSGSLSFQRNSQLNYGGDVLNTAIYYSRLTSNKTGFLTALGNDVLSNNLIDSFQNEHIDTTSIIQIPNMLPGLYAIQTDGKGERSFYYWRDNAPVRSLFLYTKPKMLAQLSQSYHDIYLSGISLSRWDAIQLKVLSDWLSAHKQLGNRRIIFDLNYRPKCWQNPSETHATLDKFLPLCDLVITTFDDEKLLFKDNDSFDTLKRYKAYGIKDIVIKQGPMPTLCYHNNQLLSITPEIIVSQPVDTTAAGDSFNSAYLAALSCQLDIESACRFAQSFAAEIIQHKGAIIDKSITKKYCQQLQKYTQEV
ncbi:sugar kinase [Cysteiniphilum halobium]|uniref:sugar kinase n=1 Tax=Cysteiniphilum halobium TaxID=2219059 RepID=UPI000E654177|nr:sugar kinase [Cysteiniphilum halobium]